MTEEKSIASKERVITDPEEAVEAAHEGIARSREVLSAELDGLQERRMAGEISFNEELKGGKNAWKRHLEATRPNIEVISSNIIRRKK